MPPVIREYEGNGIVSEMHFTADGLIENRVQDVQPVLERNKRLVNDGDGYTPSRDMVRVASIPMIVVEQWLKEGVDIFDPNCRDEINRRLDSSEWAHLRTAPGRLR